MTIEVSLADIAGSDEEGKEAGTYVTFHSSETVTIETIKYGDLVTHKFDKESDSGPAPLSMTLPIAMKFEHGEQEHCAKAKLDLVDLLNNNNKKVKMDTDELEGNNECKP